MRRQLLALWVCVPQAVDAQGWNLYTHSVGEQGEIRNGELRGRPHAGKRAYYLELVRALKAEKGMADPIEEVPLARGLRLVQTQPQVAFFNLNRSPERENTVRWVGPISQENFYLYEGTQTPTQVKRLDEATHLPVCAVNGTVAEQVLRQQGFSQLSRHNSYAGCFRMLAFGRVKLVASAEISLTQQLRDAQLLPDQVRATPAIVHSAQGYIALSPTTPEAEVASWQEALAQLQRTGKLRTLYSRYAE